VEDPARHLLDAIDAALVGVDPALVVVEWNAATERLTGVARAAALGRPAADVLPLLRDAELAARLARAVAGETPGAGLGLSIAKKIMDAHDGKIVVKNLYGESESGTRFTVVIPRNLQTPEMRRQAWMATDEQRING